MKGRSATPVPPGDVLAIFLGSCNMTQGRLATALGVGRRTVNEIVGGRRNITPDMAIRLGIYLDTGPEYWLQLQLESSLHRQYQKPGLRLDYAAMRARCAKGRSWLSK